MLSIDVQPWGGGVVVRLGGRGDFEAIAPLREALQGVALQRPRAVVVDAAGLEFIGSGGIGVLVEFRRGVAKAGARVAIAGASEYVENCFRLSRLDAAFELFGTVEEAKEALAAS